METLAYLHLACENELPDRASILSEPNLLKRIQRRGWAYVRVLSIVSGIAIALVANAAIAQTILRQGSSGEAVSELQTRLKAVGCYDGSITGYFGTQTRDAVIRCQQRNGLRPDGIVGPETYNIFARGSDTTDSGTPTYGTESYSTPAYGQILRLGDRGQAVSALQSRLRDRGYYYGQVDGIFGADTESAVLQLQRDNNLTQDGIVGAQVYAALDSGSVPPIVDRPPVSTGLSPGDNNQRVLSLQRRLNSLGYSVQETGYYGSQTQDAVFRFQQAQQLPATGVADRQTLIALGEDTANSDQPSTSRRYSVIIPTPDGVALARVQRVIPNAFPQKSRLGIFVRAGSYVTPEAAERRTQVLRSQGFSDARVVFE